MSVNRAEIAGEPLVYCVHRDITARKWMVEELRDSEARNRAILNAIPDLMFIQNQAGVYLDCHATGPEKYLVPPEQFLGRTHFDVLPPALAAQFLAAFENAILNGEVQRVEYELPLADGLHYWEARVTRIDDNRLLTIVRDMTKYKQSEQERARLESQLLQAQKMESVGRLAGGVAHDFNNMLSVVIGQSEMALESVDPSQPVHNDLLRIQEAGRRAADLTRQLLAFARKQTISPKVLDLNETVESMLKMLRRLVGEDMDLAWRPCSSLWQVKMDPSQVDQILANLVVNARDAVGGIGNITIETDNIILGDSYSAEHMGCVPGEYILLAITDDGHGIDEETLAHIFEPFFTTKGIGEGTGLGLATVYGIIKQNEGHIDVQSQPGVGTTFRIYIPRYGSERVEEAAEEAVEKLTGDETVLIVEDDEAILNIGMKILGKLGYTVLAAYDPEEAVRLAEEYTGRIHLLVTDVVMPRMNGRQLKDRLSAIRPGMKCLFMSGYPSDVIAHRGILEESIEFIQKPLSISTLARKVRELLDK